MSPHLSPDEILDYLHDELAPAEDAVVFEHLAQCPACRAQHEAEAQIGNALRSAFGEERELPPSIKAAVWEAIRKPRISPWSTLLRPLVAATMAAAVAAGAYIAVLSASAPKAPQLAVDARYYFALHSAATRQENPLADHSAPIINAVTASEGGTTPSLQIIEAGDAPAFDDAPSR